MNTLIGVRLQNSGKEIINIAAKHPAALVEHLIYKHKIKSSMQLLTLLVYSSLTHMDDDFL
jgi:hypothetical protein